MAIQYEILPKQRKFLQDCQEIPYPAYIGGFGSGKTHILCLQALIESARNPNTYGLIGAPTYRLLTDTTYRKFKQLCPEHWLQLESKAEFKVTLINGSEIIFRSLDSPGRLTNLELDWFGLDEIGEVKVDTFRMLQSRLRRPGGSHRGYGVGNPAGPTHWTYEYFVLKASEYPDTYRLTNAPSAENTFLEETYVEEMKKSFGENSLYFKRFVLGEFVAFEGAYWPHFDIRPYPTGHILKYENALDIFPKSSFNKLKWGKVVDFGFEHPFVILWYVTDGDKIVFVDEYHKRHGLLREHCIRANKKEEDLVRCFGNRARPRFAWTDHEATIKNEIIHQTDGQGNKIGFPCKPAKKEVFESIILVQMLIERNALYITDRCQNTRLEIPSYRAKPMDKSDKEAPIKEKDDTCDCVRMSTYMELRHYLNIKIPKPKSEPPPHEQLSRQKDLYGVGPEVLDD